MSSPGTLLAKGRWNDVYDLGDGRVLRRFRDPTRSAEFEAEVMRHARAHGVRVPEVFSAQGTDLVMSRATGPTMLSELTRHPASLARNAATLAMLHQAVHAVPPLPALEAPFGPGGSLLHLDLHPNNVILSPDGPVLIDWEGAVCGPAEADLAHTWLLLRTSAIPGPPLQRLVGWAGQALFARVFLAQAGSAAVRPWQPAVATRRLADPSLLPAEALRIHRLLGRRLAPLPGGAAEQ